MLNLVQPPICVTLERAVFVLLLALIAAWPPAALGNGDTACQNAKASLQQSFEPSGMSPTQDTLVLLIRDSDANHEERSLSLIVLGCSGDQRMAPVMLEALRDPSPDIRASVMVGMRYLKSPRAVSPMVGIIRDRSEDENVRQLASGVLSQIAATDPIVAAAIGEAARDTTQSPNVRLNHVFSLGRLTSEASVDELKGLLEDDDPDMLATTAIALAQHDVEESVPYLVDAVLSPYTQFWLKATAARYLEHLVDQDFIFAEGNGFKAGYGQAVQEDEIEPALAEFRDWWQRNREKYELRY